ARSSPPRTRAGCLGSAFLPRIQRLLMLLARPHRADPAVGGHAPQDDRDQLRLHRTAQPRSIVAVDLLGDGVGPEGVAGGEPAVGSIGSQARVGPSPARFSATMLRPKSTDHLRRGRTPREGTDGENPRQDLPRPGSPAISDLAGRDLSLAGLGRT